MRLHKFSSVVALATASVILFACAEPNPIELGGRRSLPPPTVGVSTTVRPAPGASGGIDLVVSAVVHNPHSKTVTLLVGAACAPYVGLFANPSGESQSHVNGTMGCPLTSPAQALAPGDSITLFHVLRAQALEAFAPGKYGIDIAITTTTSVQGSWGGNIDLPLTLPPPAR
jgi:hypothetical protein